MLYFPQKKHGQNRQSIFFALLKIAINKGKRKILEALLGLKQVVKATEVRKGDFLEGDCGVSTAEVIDVRVQPDVVLVNLAVKGVVRLDPTWDVAVFRKEGTVGAMHATVRTRQIIASDDSAWCINCNRDTAFCLCICYVCYGDLEACHCKCAQCDTQVVGGGLCEVDKAGWDAAVQGPEPDSSEEVGICVKCGTPFCQAFELDPSGTYSFGKAGGIVRTAYHTDRTVCLRCDS